MKTAAAVTAATVTVLLAGCGQAVPDRVREASEQLAAKSSHLTNDSGMPVTYHVLDEKGDRTLGPGEDIVNRGGSWLTPLGFSCTWQDGAGGESHIPVTIRSSDRNTWTQFTGYDEVITRCAPLG